MIWVAYTSAAACSFDSSCTCTATPPQLGQVRCHNAPVHLPHLNSSKLFTLSLSNNDLDTLQPNLLQGTGLYKLEISRNPVYGLHEESLTGLERTLWELHITNCKLSALPGNALRHLYKLRTLNLTGNEIMEINADQLKGVGMSLQVLILSNNALTVLPAGVFGGLQHLELLDLSGNSIATFIPATFTPPPPKLFKLNLADNLFEHFPYKELTNIRSLRILDMSFNLIIQLDGGPAGGKLSLDTLNLEYNQITLLGAQAMVNFDVANKTSFRANPISEIEPNAFRGCRISELILAECQLSEINPESFNDLENTLQVLDLSGNNISAFSFDFLQRYNSIRSVQLDWNQVTDMKMLEDPESGEQLSLLQFDISGKTNQPITLRNFPRLTHLQSLTFSRTYQPTLSNDDFSPFSVELETLKILDGGLTSLSAQLFKNTRGIKTLDFTDNNIESVDTKCFVEVGHSLETLILTHALAKKISNFPGGFLKPLNALRVLKLNHNNLQTFPQDVSKLSNLKILHLQDNVINSLGNQAFKEDIHTKLEEINLSFNRISKILSGTFTDLNKIKNIYLSDNTISQLDRGSFANLMTLTGLWLRGNKIATLPVEAFQNLPNLNMLDLAYNSLKDFNFACLEQVGMLSELVVNISHNSLQTLRPNSSISGKDIVYTNIQVLDMSYNNMTHIGQDYLLPVQHSLTHLYLSHNGFVNATRDILPEMPHLQLIDWSFNSLSDIEFDTLRGVRNLQVISLAHNNLQDIPNRLFSSLNSLRRLDLSHNKISTLMDSSITSPNLARLDLSHNVLSRAPLTIFTPTSASCLYELDLSHNKINGLPSAESFGRFNNLRYLDLSGNRLSEIGNSFSLLPHLRSLSLAHNSIHIGGKDFGGLEHTLNHLDLTNISVSYVPSLPLPSLLTLRMAHNMLTYLPPDMATNLTNLKHLDVSYNSLQAVPSFPQLKSLNLAGNQITVIYNNTFKTFSTLMDLNIQQLPLSEFDSDSLSNLVVLQLIHLSNYKQIAHFNVPQWIEKNKSLRTLCFELSEGSSFTNEMQGHLPYKVRHILLSGKNIKSLPDTILRGVRYPNLKLTLRNTSVETISSSIFSSLEHVRNVSLDLHNNSIKALGNPSNIGSPNIPRKTFLNSIYMQDNQWSCDCQLGWVETWQRKVRQYDHEYDLYEDSRQTKCRNKQNKPLITVLKADLECGWSSAIVIGPQLLLVMLLTLIPHLVLSQNIFSKL